MRHWLSWFKMDDKSTLSRYWTIDRTLLHRPRLASSYHHLRRRCREKGILFEDPDFPADNKSLYIKNRPHVWPIEWKRPYDMSNRPRFIAEKTSSHSVDQGELGDCCLLSAISCLTMTPKLLDRVVPPEQGFDHNYCGLFRFRFWQFGEWLEVVVDDRLPTHKGKLVYLHSSEPAEFWVALLEKAYAKLYGCYELLLLGNMTRVFQDLTGGIVQSFPLAKQDRRLTYHVINSAVPRSTLLVASVQLENRRHRRLRNGLITYHAFTITGLARVRTKFGEVLLVRLHNPWGRGSWNGAWSDRSWEWDSLSERDKELLSVRARNEGEFWMAFADFVWCFSNLDLVHVGPDDWMTEPVLHSKKPWRAVLARRRWRSGYSAGGGPEYTETVSVNPQFHLHIPRNGSNKCHVVVSVMQQYETKRDMRARKKRTLYPICFAVYEVPPNLQRLTSHFVQEHQPLDVATHAVSRETVTFFTLPPGDYIVVPCTEQPNCDAKFYLRIFTDEQSNTWSHREVNDDNAILRYLGVEENVNGNPKVFPNCRVILGKLVNKYPSEIDAQQLLKVLKSYWRHLNIQGKPTLELCKSLLMLRDANISGRINLGDVPGVLHALHFWQGAFHKFDKTHSGKISSYKLRSLLWEAGVSVSNKVLECLVLRFAKNNVITSEVFLIAMVRLYLSHERYHNLDSKMKANPISPEEIILMTIYS